MELSIWYDANTLFVIVRVINYFCYALHTWYFASRIFNKIFYIVKYFCDVALINSYIFEICGKLLIYRYSYIFMNMTPSFFTIIYFIKKNLPPFFCGNILIFRGRFSANSFRDLRVQMKKIELHVYVPVWIMYTHNINLIVHMNHTRVIVLLMYKRSNEHKWPSLLYIRPSTKTSVSSRIRDFNVTILLIFCILNNPFIYIYDETEYLISGFFIL